MLILTAFFIKPTSTNFTNFPPKNVISGCTRASPHIVYDFIQAFVRLPSRCISGVVVVATFVDVIVSEDPSTGDQEEILGASKAT